MAELHFGFWRHLFYARYEKILWRPIIKDVFPHAPKSMRTRSALGPRIHEAKELRNRVFHHEPIWHWHDLVAQHHRILETVGWISPPFAELAALSDRFDDVHTMNLTQLEQHLRRLDI